MPPPTPAGPPETLAHHQRDDEAQALLASSGLREALRSEDPTALAVLVSGLLSLTTQWSDGGGADGDLDDLLNEPLHNDDLFAGAEIEFDDLPVIPIEALVESFIGLSFAETTAALHVIEAMLPDELEAARVRRALASRRHPMPEHVKGVRDVAVTRAGHMGDELGDGDNIILGLAWPGTQGVTLVAFVDQSFGTRVKDVFFLREPFDDVMDRYRDMIAEQGQNVGRVAEIEPADARASLRLAIDRGEGPDAPPLPDNWSGPDDQPLGWPQSRPFVEMLLRRMPPGGSPVLVAECFPRLSVTDAVAAFLVAAQSEGLRDAHARAAAELLARDAAQAAGHPLRWSPLQVECALSQRLPWDPEATDDALSRVGDVLPAYIRFAHTLLGVPGGMTAETMSEVGHWIVVFDTLRDSEPASRWRELAPLIDAFERGDVAPLMRRSLAERVGGESALDGLDAEPLPRVALDLEAVDPEVRDAVQAVSDTVDRWLDSSPRVAHLGELREEWRTASRRFLVGAAQRDPACLRRRASLDGRACGVLWATGIENGFVGPGAAVTAKDLAADLGVKGQASTKAEALRRAWWNNRRFGSSGFGDAGLLVSTARRRIIEQRDR